MRKLGRRSRLHPRDACKMESDTELVRSIVRNVWRVVTDVLANSDSTDFIVIDGITLELSQCSMALGEVLNGIVLSGHGTTFSQNDVTSLRELHVCVSQLFVDWETRLNQYMLLTQQFGRPRIPINIPMVCLSVSCVYIAYNYYYHSD